jgi:hypothetical protein
MEAIVPTLLGVLLGSALTLYFLLNDISGTLRIKRDPEDGDYLFLELSRGVPRIFENRYVFFKVAPRE